jgi:hypothetical protein
MRTLDGQWTVEILRTRNGEVFRVRRRAIIGAHGGSGWAAIGQIRSTVAEVAQLLGESFALLVEVESAA